MSLRRGGWKARGHRRSLPPRRLAAELLEDRRLLSIAAALDAPDPAPPMDPGSGGAGRAGFVPGEILIGFEGESAAAYRAQGAKAALAAAGGPAGGLGLCDPELLMDLPAAAGRGGRLATRWRLPAGGDVLDAVRRLAGRPGIAYAEPNYVLSIDSIPDDPRFGELWGLHNTGQSGGTADADIDAPEAWDVTTGSRSVVVAVIDTGVDYNHPDLAANIWVNAAELNGSPNRDDDRNGYVDDVHGYDFVNNDASPLDDQGHGTHLAGTIGAAGNNGVGVAGINWQVQIMPLKFLDGSGSGTTSDAIKAIEYAVANGATISNNSWGGDPYSQALYDAIRNARNAGHIFVTAAGNNGSNNDQSPFYPAGYELDNVISVAATDRNDRLASFSNYGAATVDLAAPGVDILSTKPNNAYATSSGTSMATPHVAGVVALVRGQHPELTYREVIQQVLNSVDYVPALEGRTITAGRLNAARAVGAPDIEGPRVLRSEPSGGVGGVVSSIRLTFQKSIDPASFDLADVARFDGPQGPISAAAVTAVPGSWNRKFDVAFAPQAAYGTYTMVIGPEIGDLASPPNWMDQNQDGSRGDIPADQYTASFTIGQQLVFASGDVPKSLVPLTLCTSTLTVDKDVSIADVDVRIDVAYPDVGFLDVSLVSPAGTTVSLAPYTPLLGAADYQDTVFDDEAALPIASGTPPFTGSYQPASFLSALDNQSARGTWQLRVHNLWFYGGTVNSWGLSILPNPPRLSIGDVTMAEGDSDGSGAVFSVSLSNAIGEPVTVDFATADGTATGGSDYEATGGTLTFLPGQLTKIVSVKVFGDVVDEPDETFFVNLTGAVRATIADGQGLGMIRNDEARLSVGDVSLQEGNSGSTSAAFTVSLSAASSQTVTVSYATADGTATAGSDYTAASGSLSFAPGEVSKTVAVSVKGDAANELDETFLLNLTDSGNALIQDAQGQATVLNDDPIPSLSVKDVSVTEGNSGTKNLSFTVSLSAASGRTISVPYATADGTATAGEDYAAASGTLTFLPGQSSRTVSVVLNGDDLPEPDETLLLSLGAPTNAILLDPQAVGTILNDDASVAVADAIATEGDDGTVTANVVLSLSQAVLFPVSVNYATANGTAAAGSDFAGEKGTLTFAPGETSKAIPIAVIGDPRNEADETFYVNLTQPANALVADAQAVVTIRDDDPVPRISVSGAALAEGQSGTRNLTFTLALSAPSGRNVSVNYATADDSATAGSDYVAKSGVLSFWAGWTTASLSIAVNGDADFEGDESFLLNLSSPVNATLDNDQAAGTILDDDRLQISDVSIVEGDDGVRVAGFGVSLAAPLSSAVAFDYATANGTAAAGSDYVATSGRAAIAAGQTTTTISVLVAGDLRNEPDETFYLNLSNAEGVVLADSQGAATIMDDDPLPGISITDVTIAEGNSGTKNATFTLALSAPSGRNVMLHYATADGTATAGSDYAAKSGTVTWYAGSQVQSVSVVLSGDTATEPDETFFLELSNPANAELLDSQGAATIVNDDPFPALAIADVKATEGNSGTKTFSFSVTLSAASTQQVSVQFATADGTATAGSDYVAKSEVLSFTPGQTSKSISVTVLANTAGEADETFLVNLSNPTNAVLLDAQGLGTILNDDTTIRISDAGVIDEGNGGTATAAFTVSLSAAVDHEVRVNYATANSSAAAGSDYVSAGGTLVFAPGDTAKTITALIVGDRIDEADETFVVNLSSPVGAQIADTQGIATIRDDDPQPAVSVTDASIAEGASGTKSLNFVVKLSAPSGRSVTVSYATANGTAAAGSDYAAKSGTVTFNAGSTSQTVSIAVNGDALAEPDETLTLNLTGASGATIADNQAVGTILDDDCLSIGDATVTEGSSGTVDVVFTVGLAIALPYEVRVDYATANSTATAGSDYVAASGTLVFAPGETSKSITVLGLADQADEPDQAFLVNLSNPVNTIVADAQGRGTILDDDPTPSLSITDVTVTEGNLGTKNATFTVSLSSASGQTVTVAYATEGGTAAEGTDYVGKAGTLTFYAGSVSQTVTVALNGDFDVEADESFVVNLTNPVNALLADTQGQATILNDDGSPDALAAYWAAFAFAPETPRGRRASASPAWNAALVDHLLGELSVHDLRIGALLDDL